MGAELPFEAYLRKVVPTFECHVVKSIVTSLIVAVVTTRTFVYVVHFEQGVIYTDTTIIGV